jgi:hypothetical protein
VLEREQVIGELWQRLSGVKGVAYTARNPKAEPSVNDMPCIQFFELPEKAEPVQSRGGSSAYPAYKRVLQVAVEVFVKGTSEAACSQELWAFMEEVKKALYVRGNVLIPNSFFIEVEGSRMLRPPTGENIIGVGMALEITYVEDTSKLFAQ